MSKKDQLKAWLDDNKQYADTTEVKIGNEVYTMGDLREMTSAERTTLANTLRTVETERTALEDNKKKVLDLAGKAQKLIDEYTEKNKGAAPPANNGGGADPFADPWLQPVKAALEARDKAIADLTNQLKTTLSSFGNAVNIWSEDRWDREYNSIDFGKLQKKSREEILKFATDNKIVDRHGIPSISAAWNRMSEADRLAAQIAEAEARGEERGIQKSLASRITPSGVAGAGQAPPTPEKRPNGPVDLGDLYSEAIKDPELRQLLEQANSVGLA